MLIRTLITITYELFSSWIKWYLYKKRINTKYIDTCNVVGFCLKCYNDGEEQIVKCDENLGYRTCFIRYNESKIFWSL